MRLKRMKKDDTKKENNYKKELRTHVLLLARYNSRCNKPCVEEVTKKRFVLKMSQKEKLFCDFVNK